MKTLILLTVLLVPCFAVAQEFEYMVVYLPYNSDTTIDPKKIKVFDDGSGIDLQKSEIINSYASKGWELVQIFGNPSLHSIYLKRPKQPAR